MHLRTDFVRLTLFTALGFASNACSTSNSTMVGLHAATIQRDVSMTRRHRERPLSLYCIPQRDSRKCGTVRRDKRSRGSTASLAP